MCILYTTSVYLLTFGLVHFCNSGISVYVEWEPGKFPISDKTHDALSKN